MSKLNVFLWLFVKRSINLKKKLKPECMVCINQEEKEKEKEKKEWNVLLTL